MPEHPSEQTAVAGKRLPRWRWTPRETRMLIYLLVVAAVAAWKFVPRPWHPAIALETPHHVIYSSATTRRQKTLPARWAFYIPPIRIDWEACGSFNENIPG